MNRQKFIVGALSLLCAAALPFLAAFASPILVVNEDNSAYFSQRKYGGGLNEAGLRDYVRELAAGRRMTHFFMCPNAMCVNVESQVMTTTWDAIRRPGTKVRDWQYGVALLHAAGVDPYAVWIDECRKQGVSPWLSIRMNDVHHASDPTESMHSDFWLGHPEFRRCQKMSRGGWTDLALDYSHREVRDYIVAFVSEMLARYDVDGVELDWMRFPRHLPPGKEAESSPCLDEVVAAVRARADDAAVRLSHPVRLGVRVPTRPEAARATGLDVAKWCASGWVDWVVPCNFFQSVDFDLPFAEWTKVVAGAARPVTVLPGLDNGIVVNGKRRALTFDEYAAFAHRMYGQGANGVYVFNIFDLPKEDGVRAALLTKGLPKDAVAAMAATAAAASVDPFIGTAGTGHCFPGPCRPFGLVQPSPETGNGSWRYCSGYNHDDAEIRCFAQTHLSGTGQASLGDVAVMPVVQSAVKRNERAELGYYAVELDGVKVEIAAGLRVARYRMTFPEGRPAGVRFDFRHGLYRHHSYLRYLTTTCTVEQVGRRGFSGLNHSDVWAPRDIAYEIRFDRDFDSCTNGVCTFARGGTVELCIALSACSQDGARRNFAAEGGLSFDRLVRDAKAAWSDYLLRFAYPGGDASARKVFYTSVYHLCIQPNLVSDAGEAPRYSTFSLWDTFRSAHPLYERLAPELVPHFVNSLLDHYTRFGYLPRWELWGRETNCMIGDPAVSVIADAYLHGLRTGVDWELAARAVRETLTENRRAGNPGFYPPREERDLLDRYGYFPCDLVPAQSVSRTLEGCYHDFKAAEFLRALGRSDDAATFERRSWNFTNLWDSATLCFRPKDSKGAWLEPFEPARQSVHYTEASALQYSWFVPHRPEWLIEAMGGRDAFLARLDAFFAGTLYPGAPRDFGQDVTGLIGDYSHGNEPCHHIPYLYAAAGRPGRTAALLKRICAECYAPTPDGICGNEDCGQMSAWFLRAQTSDLLSSGRRD